MFDLSWISPPQQQWQMKVKGIPYKMSKCTPWNINIEPKNADLEDVPFQFLMVLRFLSPLIFGGDRHPGSKVPMNRATAPCAPTVDAPKACPTARRIATILGSGDCRGHA